MYVLFLFVPVVLFLLPCKRQRSPEEESLPSQFQKMPKFENMSEVSHKEASFKKPTPVLPVKTSTSITNGSIHKETTGGTDHKDKDNYSNSVPSVKVKIDSEVTKSIENKPASLLIEKQSMDRDDTGMYSIENNSVATSSNSMKLHDKEVKSNAQQEYPVADSVENDTTDGNRDELNIKTEIVPESSSEGQTDQRTMNSSLVPLGFQSSKPTAEVNSD